MKGQDNEQRKEREAMEVTPAPMAARARRVIRAENTKGTAKC